MISAKDNIASIAVQPKQTSLTETDQRKLKLKKATQAFEAIFISQLLKSMRSTSFNQEGENGFGKDIMMSMADEGVSMQFAKKGMLGIGKLLYERLAKRLDAMPPDDHQLKITKTNRQVLQDIPAVPPPPKLRMAEKKTLTMASPKAAPAAVANIPRAPVTSTGSNLVEPKSEQAGRLPALEKYISQIRSAAAEANLSEDLIKSIIMRESGGNSQAVSHKGAAGLMQLMPDTAKAMGVNDPLDPEENIRGGAKYLRSLIDRFGDLKTALTAYNAGPANVERHGGAAHFPETDKYVQQILSDLRKTK